ncbi:MAG: right-handed parallel beta-helix repeat-containing protein, partial [Kofleriaceae bacterium]
IVSDDNFALSAPYLHMGIAVGGGATDFEIEYVEVTRSGFAGIRLLNPPSEGVDKPMANVRVHDTYVHDVAGEGFYFGWTGGAPSNQFPGLQIYNNRILRTGNEALQIQDVGDGSRIHHNTFVSGGLHWLDNGLGRYQDNLSQISVREGEIELDHNVFIDGAGALVSFFSQPQTGDGARHVTFHDNYFAGALSVGSYLGGTSAAGSSFTFASNTFRDAIFGYTPVDPAATDPGHWLAPGAEFRAPIVLQGNHWQAGKQLIRGLDGGDGTVGSATASGNVAGEPAAIELRDHWHRPGHHLTAWAEKATVAPGSPTVTYRAGDLVMHGARPDFYEATAEISGAAPGTSSAWSMMVPPGDDVRVIEGTTYAELGVR